MELRHLAGTFATLAPLMLGACGAPVVTQTVVNHAYEGRLKRLVLYDHLYGGLRDQLTRNFDAQFATDMQRCGIPVRVVDGSDVELNAKQEVLQAIHDLQADTVLIASWTQRQTGSGGASQTSLFTLGQIRRSDDPTTNLGEVWKVEISQGLNGLKLVGDNDGALLARRVADQMENDRMVQGCTPRPQPAPTPS